MKLPSVPTGVTTLAGLITWLRTLAASIASAWAVEHAADGTHRWSLTTPTFDATRFTGDGTITWTVGSNDLSHERYGRLGSLMYWTLYLASTSTGGSASPYFHVRLPERYVLADSCLTGAGYTVDAGAAVNAVVQGVIGDNFVYVYKYDGSNWSAAAANNTQVSFQVWCEVTEP